MTPQTRLMSAPHFTSSQKLEVKQSQRHTYLLCRTRRPLISNPSMHMVWCSFYILFIPGTKSGRGLRALRQLLPSGDAAEGGWDVSESTMNTLPCQVTEQLWLLSLHLSSSSERTPPECSTFSSFLLTGSRLRSRRSERFTKNSQLEYLQSLWVCRDGVHTWKDSRSPSSHL